MVLEQAEKNNLWEREDRVREHFFFSHLYTGLNSYAGIQRFIGIERVPTDAKDPVEPEYYPQASTTPCLVLWKQITRRTSRNPIPES